MKAITIKQPWASLIVHGIKNIENRFRRKVFPVNGSLAQSSAALK